MWRKNDAIAVKNYGYSDDNLKKGGGQTLYLPLRKKVIKFLCVFPITKYTENNCSLNF